MFLIENNGVTDPGTNLALEEYCLRRLDPANEFLLFYVNDPAVIIGKHQNPFRETNWEAAREMGLPVIRRISGGGAVYHDRGNLNFSFITAYANENLDYFKKLMQPIVGALHRLGVPAAITEKNTIRVEGRKVSGTSQYTNMKRMLSHGTLLFNADLAVLDSVLVSNPAVIHSKGVESIPSQVANIADHLPHPLAMVTFRGELIREISRYRGGINEFHLSPRDWDRVHRLAAERYNTWQWNFGRSPTFTAVHKIPPPATDLYAHVGVAQGIIREIGIVGEHIRAAAVSGEFVKAIGKPYTPEWNKNLYKDPPL